MSCMLYKKTTFFVYGRKTTVFMGSRSPYLNGFFCRKVGQGVTQMFLHNTHTHTHTHIHTQTKEQTKQKTKKNK